MLIWNEFHTHLTQLRETLEIQFGECHRNIIDKADRPIGRGSVLLVITVLKYVTY